MLMLELFIIYYNSIKSIIILTTVIDMEVELMKECWLSLDDIDEVKVHVLFPLILIKYNYMLLHETINTSVLWISYLMITRTNC